MSFRISSIIFVIFLYCFPFIKSSSEINPEGISALNPGQDPIYFSDAYFPNNLSKNSSSSSASDEHISSYYLERSKYLSPPFDHSPNVKSFFSRPEGKRNNWFLYLGSAYKADTFLASFNDLSDFLSSATRLKLKFENATYSMIYSYSNQRILDDLILNSNVLTITCPCPYKQLKDHLFILSNFLNSRLSSEMILAVTIRFNLKNPNFAQIRIIVRDSAALMYSRILYTDLRSVFDNVSSPRKFDKIYNN